MRQLFGGLLFHTNPQWGGHPPHLINNFGIMRRLFGYLLANPIPNSCQYWQSKAPTFISLFGDFITTL